MIDPKELRWGNLVYGYFAHEYNVCTIGSLPTDAAFTDRPLKGGETTQLAIVPYQNIIPIPITEEWLERFDTQPYEVNFQINRDSSEAAFMIGEYHICSIKYIHQLQNLYFALTGTELEIKELLIKPQ